MQIALRDKALQDEANLHRRLEAIRRAEHRAYMKQNDIVLSR